MNLFSSFFGEGVPDISALEVYERLKQEEPPFLLDVRQPEEYSLGHVAGAELIPLGQLNRRIREVPAGREIVCICASGHRSVAAVKILTAAGYSASSMKSGMVAWLQARLPIDKGASNKS